MGLKVTVRNVRSEDLRIFRTWLYTGELQGGSDPRAMLKMADMYALDKLTQDCVEMLKKTMSEGTVMEVLKLMHLHTQSHCEVALRQHLSTGRSGHIFAPCFYKAAIVIRTPE